MLVSHPSGGQGYSVFQHTASFMVKSTLLTPCFFPLDERVTTNTIENAVRRPEQVGHISYADLSDATPK